MSDKPPPDVFGFLEDLVDEAELEEIAKKPREEVRKELAESGLDVGRLLQKLEQAPQAGTGASGGGGAKVTSLEEARAKRRRPTWVLALAAAGVLAILAAGGGAVVVALREPAPTPTPTSPVPSVPTAPPSPSPEVLAARAKADELRKLASAECRQQSWKQCSADWTQAHELDPGGDSPRAMDRLHKQMEREEIRESAQGKDVPLGPRFFLKDARPDVVRVLSSASGQAMRLQCAAGPEPKQLCDQLAPVIKSAGWNVTRVDLAPDAGAPRGLTIEVATDADAATQASADLLAESLIEGLLYAHGPWDMAPGSGASLQLTVGTK